MRKSFYHYMMKHRSEKIKDQLEMLVDFMYNDHSFPKQSSEYDEISSYLELSGSLKFPMSVFDEAWNLYLEEV